MTRIEAPRGTHDVLPSEQPLWQKVTGEMERLCALYGYRRIQTPGFEDTDLFRRTAGVGSDIVQKEMYTFEDEGGRSLTLRPEGTAPICRAYVEHGMHREPQPVKLYTLAPMYRYAAPQRGRYREHYQLSLESIGSADPAVDAEVLQFYDALLRSLGVKQYELRLNSIGDRNCRPAYLERLNAWLDEHADVLDDDARQKRATSPLRVFDVKNEHVRAALQDAPKIGESLCAECAEHFAQVRSLLDGYGVAYTVDPTLVRGLDYYTRTTFEFIGPDESAQASTICGGGQVRLPRRGDRRRPDARHRLRCRHRAADPLARARRRDERVAAARPLPRRRGRVEPPRRPHDDGRAARRRPLVRRRLRRPLAEGAADAGAEARRSRRDPDE